MRVRYCCTISCDVVRFCSSAFRMSSMLASTTVNGTELLAGAFDFWASAGDSGIDRPMTAETSTNRSGGMAR